VVVPLVKFQTWPALRASGNRARSGE
jgi:hypothetical protein